MISEKFNQTYGIHLNSFCAVANDKMSFSEHVDELRDRIIFSFLLLIMLTLSCLFNLRQIVKIFQAPAIGVKFLQFAPGEYFFVSLKIVLFTGLLLSSPLILYQIIVYILPGSTKIEKSILLPAILGSVILFGMGLTFAYFFLVPTTLKFFISYSNEMVEPFWSFDNYFDFISFLIFATGLAFQIPIIQVVIGFFNVFTGQQMLSNWKYALVISTILGAILTPSTDPLTQILLSTALLSLYLSGAGLVIFLKK